MSATNETDSPRRACEQLLNPDQVPLYDLVPMRGLDDQLLDARRGVLTSAS